MTLLSCDDLVVERHHLGWKVIHQILNKHPKLGLDILIFHKILGINVEGIQRDKSKLLILPSKTSSHLWITYLFSRVLQLPLFTCLQLASSHLSSTRLLSSVLNFVHRQFTCTFMCLVRQGWLVSDSLQCKV
jgi:hypothetical protein